MAETKTLLTGWFSFLHGEVTAGDVLALHHVQDGLDAAGIPYDTACSPGFRPGALQLPDADPHRYDRLVFVCGPLHGTQVAELHTRFARCLRIAVGVSVIDPADPAAQGFHRILARDAPGAEPAVDLAIAAPATAERTVVGVILTSGQHEYGPRRRHEDIARTVTGWLADKDCATLELDTRLGPDDWRRCASPGQFESTVARLDLVVTDRLHGLVLALRTGVPALAIDPVLGGAKVSAQATACRWPALVPAEQTEPAELDRWWDWCLDTGRGVARQRCQELRYGGQAQRDVQELVEALGVGQQPEEPTGPPVPPPPVPPPVAVPAPPPVPPPAPPAAGRS